MALIDQLLKQLSGAPAAQIGSQLGLDQSAVNKAITTALPVILGGLAKNAQSSEGASALTSALDRDHDGSILDDLVGFATQASSGGIGDGILGHVFGSNRSKAENAVGTSSAISGGQAAKLMAMLAPIVMGYLGKKKRESNLDASQMATELQAESERHGPQESSLVSMVSKMLDSDGDGSVMDDVLKIGGSLLSRWNS